MSINTRGSETVVEAFNKMDNIFLRFLVFVFCLLSYYQITNGKEARIQRRFMWKQMGMENLVSDMASRAFGMKHVLSDLVPTINSVVPNKLVDYLPSETTRIKYIIRNPTTNQPMKIIKILPSKKIVKIIPKPTITSESKPISLQKITVPNYPNAEQIKKLELEQELISEGRLPFKSENDIFNTTPNMEKYKEQSKQENDEEYNSWSPLLDSNKISYFSTSKPSTMSPLHTSIMAEPIPIPEKLIYSTTYKDHAPNHNVTQLQNYNDKTFQTNSYEVTENIAEESIALPLINNAHIRLRIGTPPSRFSTIQAREKDTKRANSFEPNSENFSTEDPPNYPVNFLRRFQEQSKADSISPSMTNNPSLITKQQKHSKDPFEDLISNASNITNNRETLKSRTRWQEMHSHTKNGKWSINPPDRIEKSAEKKYVVLSSTTTETTSLADIKQYTLPTAVRPKKQLSTPQKTSKNADIREVRMHSRGRIKFGDKIVTD